MRAGRTIVLILEHSEMFQIFNTKQKMYFDIISN